MHGRITGWAIGAMLAMLAQAVDASIAPVAPFHRTRTCCSMLSCWGFVDAGSLADGGFAHRRVIQCFS